MCLQSSKERVTNRVVSLVLMAVFISSRIFVSIGGAGAVAGVA